MIILFAHFLPSIADILVLGLGDRKAMSSIDPKAIIALKKLGINLEILTTVSHEQCFVFDVC